MVATKFLATEDNSTNPPPLPWAAHAVVVVVVAVVATRMPHHPPAVLVVTSAVIGSEGAWHDRVALRISTLVSCTGRLPWDGDFVSEHAHIPACAPSIVPYRVVSLLVQVYVVEFARPERESSHTSSSSLSLLLMLLLLCSYSFYYYHYHRWFWWW